MKTSDSFIQLLLNESTWTNWVKMTRELQSRCSEQGAVHGADQTLLSSVLTATLGCLYPGAALTKALFNTFCKLFADVIDRVISFLSG